MKKFIQCALLLFFVLPVVAEENTLMMDSTQQLNEVKVLGTRSKVASEKLRVIHTLTSDDIKNIPATSIIDLLEYLPGVDVRTRGGNGVQTDITMRGGTFDQVVILLNGVNITDPHTGHHNGNIPVDIDLIDRIEILQGTSMNIFGLSSFSGAINIITGTSEVNETKVNLAAGDYDYIQSSISTKQNVGKWNLSGSASYNQSSGYMYNTDYEYGNGTVQAVYTDEKIGNINMMVGGQLKGFGANSFYSLSYPDQYEATKTLFGSFIWDKRIGDFGIEASLYNRTHTDRFELFREGAEAASWYTNHNYHLTNTSGINAKGSWYSSFGKTAVGVELRNENILSNVLGEELDEPVSVWGNDSTYYTYSKNRLNINYFAEQSIFINKFSASAGISGNYNTMFGNNIAFGANTGYQFTEGGNVFVSINRGIRLPTFTDLYYNSTTQISNPDLKPEENLTTEIGVNYAINNFTTRASGYYRWGTNIIDWIKMPDDEQWQSVNHSEVNAVGGEIMLGYRYGKWVPKIEATYSFCNLSMDSGDYISKYALDYLRHKLTLTVEHRIYKGFGANWQLTYQERNGEYSDVDGITQSYQPVWLLDGQVFWKGKNTKLYIEATNITNQQYYDYGGIAQPGIWAKGGISIALNR